jgi:hypothetical protein
MATVSVSFAEAESQLVTPPTGADAPWDAGTEVAPGGALPPDGDGLAVEVQPAPIITIAAASAAKRLIEVPSSQHS